MKKAIINSLCLMLTVLTFAFFASPSMTAKAESIQARTGEVVESNGTPSNNRSYQNYSGSLFGYWSAPMKSYVYQNEDETLVRVENIDSYVLVETYTKNGQTVLSKKTINQELDLFGGCFIGENYNFLVFGQKNTEESDSFEVVRVVKYTKDWTRLDDCRITGVNTTIPFNAGSLRMTEDDGKLYIHTCHEMYSGHQANMTFKIDQNTMDLEESMHDVLLKSSGYVSHSFNQFIKTDGTDVFRVDHGDAYPRGISITRFDKQDSIKKCSYTLPVSFRGGMGNNYTGAKVGGFELSENNCIISYSFVDYYSSTDNQNIKVSITDKSFKTTKTVDITNYAEEDNIDCLTPHLIKINNNLFLILWEERDAQGKFTTSAATIDGNGNIISISCNKEMRLSDCQPILCSDQKVRWYTTCNTSPTWYTVDPYNIDPGSKLGLTDVKIGGRAADALRINWAKNANAAGYIIEQYQSGKWVRIARIANNATTTYRVAKLSPGTSYQFRICGFAFDGSTPIYGDYTEVTGKTNPSVMTGVKIGGRAGNALRLNWTKNPTAAGYIVEQYKSGKWVRVARIANNTTTTYRVEKLSPLTTYQFRIRAFNYDDKTAIYGSYAYVNGKTNPSIMTGVKIGGRAADALRLNWTKNPTAAGYIIEQYKNGSWVRIARISGNTTTTYRVEKLSPLTTYQFRIQAFNYDGKTAIYGNYAYVNGKTNPSIMTGVKIGGTAKDALRINWTKNPTAAGYIIEQYQSGKWVRIAKISNNATTTYRVEKLSPSTTYQFRIRAFNFDGSTALYGSYAYISGKTI